jgi:hypothetical protein
MYSMVPMKELVRWCSASLMLPLAAGRQARRAAGVTRGQGQGEAPGAVEGTSLSSGCIAGQAPAVSRQRRRSSLTQPKVGDAHMALAI